MQSAPIARRFGSAHNLRMQAKEASVGPVFIGFSDFQRSRHRRAIAVKATFCCACEAWDDVAHLSSKCDTQVPICRNRHKFATASCSLRNGLAAADALGSRHKQNHRRFQLPKRWAKAGAFSHLTRWRKLAQY